MNHKNININNASCTDNVAIEILRAIPDKLFLKTVLIMLLHQIRGNVLGLHSYLKGEIVSQYPIIGLFLCYLYHNKL